VSDGQGLGRRRRPAANEDGGGTVGGIGDCTGEVGAAPSDRVQEVDRERDGAVVAVNPATRMV